MNTEDLRPILKQLQSAVQALELLLAPEQPKLLEVAKSLPPKRTQCDDDFLDALTKDPAYAEINVKAEYLRMVNWCRVNNKLAGKRRFVRWLNRAASNLEHDRFTPQKPACPLDDPDLTSEGLAKLSKEDQKTWIRRWISS